MCEQQKKYFFFHWTNEKYGCCAKIEDENAKRNQEQKTVQNKHLAGQGNFKIIHNVGVIILVSVLLGIYHFLQVYYIEALMNRFVDIKRWFTLCCQKRIRANCYLRNKVYDGKSTTSASLSF